MPVTTTKPRHLGDLLRHFYRILSPRMQDLKSPPGQSMRQGQVQASKSVSRAAGGTFERPELAKPRLGESTAVTGMWVRRSGDP